MADRPLSQRIASLKELTQMLQISATVQVETAAVLDELSNRLYACEEDCKRLTAASRAQAESLRSLEKRYSELLYKLSQVSNTR